MLAASEATQCAAYIYDDATLSVRESNRGLLIMARLRDLFSIYALRWKEQFLVRIVDNKYECILTTHIPAASFHSRRVGLFFRLII